MNFTSASDVGATVPIAGRTFCGTSTWRNLRDVRYGSPATGYGCLIVSRI